MKAYKKEKRNISVIGNDFIYMVIENSERVILRVYPKSLKNTLCEYYLDWKDYHDINLYLPSVAKGLIHYAVNDGWNFLSSNQSYNHQIKSVSEFNSILRSGSNYHFMNHVKFDHIREMLFCLEGVSVTNNELIGIIIDNGGLESYHSVLQNKYREFIDER